MRNRLLPEPKFLFTPPKLLHCFLGRHKAKLGSDVAPDSVMTRSLHIKQQIPEGGLGLAGWRDFKKRSV